MQYLGICHKMKTSLGETVETSTGELAASVEYKLNLDPFECHLNPFLQHPIEITWTGQIFCVGCGAKTNKSFSQGYCYKCMISTAACDMCMVRPETCHFDAGTCREPDWAESFCFQNHIVYLANSSGIKVGITRHNQMPTRWLDQGATQALPILQASNRKLVGLIEVMFCQSVADKTNWRNMLKGEANLLDLHTIKHTLFNNHQAELDDLMAKYPNQIELLPQEHSRTFAYPVMQYPEKITSHNLDKNPSAHGVLVGIKGQYLILDTGVINLRKYTGYQLSIKSIKA